MKVTETITRECCALKDLKPVAAAGNFNGAHPVQMFCVHCGTRHQVRRIIDASGNFDIEYYRLDESLIIRIP